jgi:hypothetical protein
MPPLDRLGVSSTAVAAAAATAKKYRLLADGDSWFDYPLGKDVLDYLNNFFQHAVTKLAKAGSTLNELVYGPDELFKSDPSQGKTRLTIVVEKLRKQQFDAFLCSGGGNDIAGPEFFSFINHAASELPNPNRSVLDGVVNGTFRKAYEDMIEVLLAEAQNLALGGAGIAKGRATDITAEAVVYGFAAVRQTLIVVYFPFRQTPPRTAR